MEGFKIFQLIAILLTLLVISVNGQISTPCTSSMITSFTPCINYITGSTNNGSSLPTASCCNSLKSLMSTSMDCGCLLITASVPVQLPINQTLAISLPRACNMGGVPVQCKASGTPLPAPGPVLLGPTLPPPTTGPLSPTLPPLAAGPLSPQASKAVALAPAPDSEITLPLAPASPPMQVEAPPATVGIRPVLTPSAAALSFGSPPSSFLIFIAFLISKCY